ncbi:hypothetical protein ACFWUU_05045 [Kribbella sp. NPDC058693]|uniref:hypothetical protein n=1 Tax=Kribbella sp. NPDC058693 TaxID=3346602 RepID=UPI00365630BF
MSPTRTASYSARTQTVIAIENADGLTAAGGALWVKTDDGRVVRIDPATNRTTGELKLDTNSDPSDYCQGIGTDQAAVWACATTDQGTDVVKIDPASRRIVRRVAVGKVFDQLALPSTARGLWVLSGSDVNLVDQVTGRVTKYPLGVRCLQLAAAGEVVVATSSTENAVIALDAGNGSVIARTTLPAPRLAAVSGSDIWVDTSDGLVRLSRGLSVKAKYPSLGAGVGGDLVATPDAVWLRAGNGIITRLDPSTGQAVEQVAPDGQQITAGSMLIAYDSIWTTSGDEGTLTRLRLN